jgi:hypothetical protein
LESAADDTGNDLPFPLHKGAVPAAEYHLHWPADLAHRLADLEVAPLTVHYVRIDVEGQIGRLVAHYAQQVKDAEERFLERGRWLDAVQQVSEMDRLRSVDVMLTRFTEKPPVSYDVPEKLLVEVLVVEAPDPNPSSSSHPSQATAARP